MNEIEQRQIKIICILLMFVLIPRGFWQAMLNVQVLASNMFHLPN